MHDGTSPPEPLQHSQKQSHGHDCKGLRGPAVRAMYTNCSYTTPLHNKKPYPFESAPTAVHIKPPFRPIRRPAQNRRQIRIFGTGHGPPSAKLTASHLRRPISANGAAAQPSARSANTGSDSMPRPSVLVQSHSLSPLLRQLRTGTQAVNTAAAHRRCRTWALAQSNIALMRTEVR